MTAGVDMSAAAGGAAAGGGGGGRIDISRAAPRSQAADDDASTPLPDLSSKPRFAPPTRKLWPGAVMACRMAVVAALALLYLNRQAADAIVADVYAHVLQAWWFRHDSFEPVLSTLSFFPFLVGFMVIDCMVPALHRFHVQPRMSGDMHHWAVGKNLAVNLYLIAIAYIVPLLVFDYVYPRRHLKLAEFSEPPSALRLVGEIFALLAVYDVLFFIGHKTMHAFPKLYKSVHARHHVSKVTRANDAIRLTFAEEFVDVMCSIAAVNILRAHPLSRAVYDVIIVYLLVELHCGYDFPWMFHNIMPLGLVGGPPYHDRHHVCGSIHYQKFFTYLDTLFGYTPAGRKRHAEQRRLEVSLQERLR